MDRPNIILITADSLRADHCSFMGYEKKTTPFLDKLSKECLVFKRTYATSSHTSLAIPAIMTGKYPLFKGSLNIGSRITIAEYLKKLGYITVGIVSSNPFANIFSGKGRGFTIFSEVEANIFTSKKTLLNNLKSVLSPFEKNKKRKFIETAIMMLNDIIPTKREFFQSILIYILARTLLSKEDIPLFPKIDIITNKKALQIIKHLSKEYKSRPIFLWIHYMSTHIPYGFIYDDEYLALKEHLKRRRFICWVLKNQKANKEDVKRLTKYYDDGIRLFDKNVKDLLMGLEDLGILENSYIIITSDHGEQLFEHGNYGHGESYRSGCFLYDELLKIPLLIWNYDEKGCYELLSSSVDIFPTIIELSRGIKLKPKFSNRLLNIVDGISLLKVKENTYNRIVISEMISSLQSKGLENFISERLKQIDWNRNVLEVRATSNSDEYIILKYKNKGIEIIDYKGYKKSLEVLKNMGIKRLNTILGKDGLDEKIDLIYRILRF